MSTLQCDTCLQEGRPFFGICLGMQLLFEGSDESGGGEGIGLIPGYVKQFDVSKGLPVPHIGWNTLEQRRESALLSTVGASDRVYFVHSYRWVLQVADIGTESLSHAVAMTNNFT